MKLMDFNQNDPRLNMLFTDNMKLTKENKKLWDKVSCLESRLDEIESQLDDSDDTTYTTTDNYSQPENDVNIYIILTLLIMFIVIMLVAMFQGGKAL